MSLAHIAQTVEHFLGKEEVTGSSPVVGSKVVQIGSLDTHIYIRVLAHAELAGVS